MIKRKRAASYILALALVFSLLSGTYASNITELRKQREETQARTNAANTELRGVTAQKNTVLSEIEVLDYELNTVSDELSFLSDQLTLTVAELEKTEHNLYIAVTEREQQYETYKKRVRSQYINGTVGYLDVILSASDVIDLLNRVEYVNRIVESDNELQTRLIETENLISAQLTDITIAKEEIEYLTDLSSAKQNELEDVKARKQALAERLANDEAMYRQRIKDLEEEDKRFTELIRAAEAEEARIAEEKRREEQRKAAAEQAAIASRAASLNTGGAMAWPVPSNGYISSQYGERDSPINGLPEFHTGMDIPAAYGASVVAVEGGVVILSGWNGGYGNTVIINHGNGVSTLYAHNSKLMVSVGDEVKKGQTIAQIGSTGYSTGPHLHFEVRINGTHRNPAGYVIR